MECCARASFDLVLMDMQMPIMDGLSATREIRRAQGAGRRVPIVALTASAMTDELDRCLQAGMDGLLTKPLQPVRLREVLERHGLSAAARSLRATAPTPASCARVQALDLARLKVLVGDDPQFMEELCRTFMASSTRLVDEMRQALTTADSGRAPDPRPQAQGRRTGERLRAARPRPVTGARTHPPPAPRQRGTARPGGPDAQAALGECASVIEVHFP